MNSQKLNSSLVFIVPIFNLKITEDIKEELSLLRVTFISADKIAAIRSRFGLNKKNLSVLKDAFHLSRPHKGFPAFVILRATGSPEKITTDCLKKVYEELSILSSSMLLFKKRTFTDSVAFGGLYDKSTLNYLFIDSTKHRMLESQVILWNFQGITIDKKWKEFQEQYYFLKLMKILNKQIKVSTRWRNDLKRAAFLIGKSYNSKDVADAFLLIMIAIESLVTQQGDHYSSILPKRLESILGWNSNWKRKKYETQINRVYKLRSEYVHDGNSNNILKDDLLFADTVAFNLLTNIVQNSHLFRSKKDLIKFSDQYYARKLLSMTRQSQLKNKSFLERQYTGKELLGF